MKAKIAVLAGLAWVSTSVSAEAADLCRARVLRDIHPMEYDAETIRRGETVDAVTQFMRDHRTGRTFFCSHGGYCLPTYAMIGGRRVPAMRLLNCTVDMAHPYTDAEETSYETVMDRRRNSAATMRLDEVDNRLLAIGMCSACAWNAAYTYTRRPNSPCGVLVRRALAGNSAARRRLVIDDACSR